MALSDLSDAKQLAIKHNHSLFRLSGVCKTIRELIDDNQDQLSAVDFNLLLHELSDIERYLKKAIDAKFECERCKATSPKKVVKVKVRS